MTCAALTLWFVSLIFSKKNVHLFPKIVEVGEYFPSRDVETTK